MSRMTRNGVLATAILAMACARPPVTTTTPARPPEPTPTRPAEPSRLPPLQIGAIVSNTGSDVLRQYSALVLEGARVAVAEAGTPRRAVELVVRDDGGTNAGAARALRELEQAGVRAVIGPLVEDALAAAAGARVNATVVLISPTAISEPAAPNVYALNVVDTRGSTALGEYARRFERIGVLHARTAEGRRQATAFVNGLPQTRRASVVMAAFDSGATTVATQLNRLRQARVQAVYFPATERQLQLVLPQIDYFGLRGVQLLGNESWIGEGARGLPQRVLEGAIAATPLWRESPDVGWGDFVGRYESAHRRTLPNPIPALGYDAARLALRALDGDLAGVTDFRGATGIFTIRDDAVTRRPFLVRIQSGRVVPVN